MDFLVVLIVDLIILGFLINCKFLFIVKLNFVVIIFNVFLYFLLVYCDCNNLNLFEMVILIFFIFV